MQRRFSIPALGRDNRRAVFRRVRGGVLPGKSAERKRGESVLVSGLRFNHGRTRTGLTNVRPDLEGIAERRCTRVEDVGLPDEQREESERQAERIEVCLSCVNDLRDFNSFAEDAVIDPPVLVVAKKFSQVGASDSWICFFSKHRVFWQELNSSQDIGIESVGIFGIEVVCDIVAGILKCFDRVVGPLQSHIAILSREAADFAAVAARRFERVFAIRFTWSCDLTSPRCDWPSLMRNPSYVSATCSLRQIFSQSDALRNTDVARPFCVRMIGRCVSAVRATQSASVVRNSLMEMMSSVGLKSNMAFSPLIVTPNIVRNYVREVKVAA